MKLLARIWIHELLHIDWVTNPNNNNEPKHVVDLRLEFGSLGNPIVNAAYGPTRTKALARWKWNTGKYILRNADSMTMYAMAKYVQNELGGIYPYLPLAMNGPNFIPGDNTGKPIDMGDFFTFNSDGTVDIKNNTLVDATEVCTAAEKDQNISQGDVVKFGYDGIADGSLYPESYLKQYAEWVGRSK